MIPPALYYPRIPQYLIRPFLCRHNEQDGLGGAILRFRPGFAPHTDQTLHIYTLGGDLWSGFSGYPGLTRRDRLDFAVEYTSDQAVSEKDIISAMSKTHPKELL